MARSSLAQTTNSANKSWVELCDEDYSSNISGDENGEDDNTDIKTDIKNNHNENIKTNTVIENQKECLNSFQDENTPAKISVGSLSKTIRTEIEIKVEKEESPWRFSYASILKNSASKSNVNDKNQTPTKQTTPKSKLVESNDENSGTVKSVKREIQREFLQDDLSLSSHLDVFHMQSPLKLEPIDDDMTSPMKIERETRSKKRNCVLPKLAFNEDSIVPDDVLMPSPKKITRLSSRRKRESGDSPLISKRHKQISETRSTPKCVVAVEPQPTELEMDEQILIRRQKQIDYGKNTVGYERYCEMVPKQKRHRKHPQTPPKHLKYSRRAWDGLIRQWRQQLHFWDPPSQGGGNIDDLDMSSMSEASSDTMSQTSSLPATPKEERKPRRNTHATRSSASECSSIADDSGCSPLN